MTPLTLQKQQPLGGTQTLQKTQYFCDRCNKEVPVYKNGSIKPHLYLFTIANKNNFSGGGMDKDGYSFELCDECAELFSMLVADFCKVSEKTVIYTEASSTAETTV